jgi:alkaline phosphatase D
MNPLAPLALTCLFFTHVNAQDRPELPVVEGLPRCISFGSCSDQSKPQPILRHVVATRPDLFVYLGDNIYGDTEDMSVLQSKYAQLGAKPEFRALRAATPVMAIWDDHDYGANDAGKEYPMKAESKEIFLNFWQEPKDSARRDHPGIYHSRRFLADGHILQVILLDTRTFRDPLAKNRFSSWKNDYHPDPDPNKTLLGAEQWVWLEAQLRQPADVRIIATSIQFAHQHNGWESWTNLPRELAKMIDTIKKTRANGVLFISGDVHWGEISVLQIDDVYPLHDVTSSGLTQDWDSLEPNQNRYELAVRENNFGSIEIDWEVVDPVVTLKLTDLENTLRVSKSIKLSTLSLP